MSKHRWGYDPTNGFWAHCSCGYSAFGFFDRTIERRMRQHLCDTRKPKGRS